jgi:hypothetical protein
MICKQMPHIYHPSQQRYNVVYNDTTSHTLEDALQTLDEVPQSILRYTQHIYPGQSTYPYMIHKPENDILYFSFPPQCIYVTRVRNTAHYKMVMEYKDRDNENKNDQYINIEHVKEVCVMPDMHLAPDTNVCIYLRNQPTRISFEVFLFKEKIRPRL